MKLTERHNESMVLEVRTVMGVDRAGGQGTF